MTDIAAELAQAEIADGGGAITLLEFCDRYKLLHPTFLRDTQARTRAACNPHRATRPYRLARNSRVGGIDGRSMECRIAISRRAQVNRNAEGTLNA